MNNIFGITFQTWNNIIYLPLIILFTIIVLFRFRKSLKITNQLISYDLQSIILNFSPKKKLFKFFLLILSTFFLFFSLLSPSWNKREESFEQFGRDIFIALDISRSMLAKDFEPNRLAWSKHKIKELIANLKNDRIGLILFSGSAFVHCPLTSDYNSFFSLLDQADTEITSTGTTSIEHAIKLTLEKFNSFKNKKNKLLIIFTDGEDFSSNLSGIKEEASKQELSIFTVGVGTENGAPIPLYDEKMNLTGHQLDNDGKVVITRLNEGILKALSENCGGYYVPGTTNNNDLNEIILKVNQFEKEKFEDKKLSYLDQQYPYFVTISLICFALEWIL